MDSSGNLYIANAGNQRIRKVSAGATITTVAGNDVAGLLGRWRSSDQRCAVKVTNGVHNDASPYVAFCNDLTNYKDCSPGTTVYVQDIAKLVTLDTPHGGDELARCPPALPATDLFACFAIDTLDRHELEDTRTITALLQLNAGRLPERLTLASIESFTTPGVFSDFDDGIVTQEEQSFTRSIVGISRPCGANENGGSRWD